MIAVLALVSAVASAEQETRNMADPRTQEAIALMMGFAEQTGLTSENPPQRYLWTDAFAVCNFLGLARATGEDRYTALALRLVDQVHHTLARHRHDDRRTGWISGLSESEGESHPTQGGLRIGKELTERGPREAFDERLEWERDGQYFHYLTQWMHALDQVTRSTGQPNFNRWARELAETAYRSFTYLPAPGTRRRMYWKMSIDLTRPLVSSMGQHDPLAGYLTTLQLRATADRLPALVSGPHLKEEINQLAAMVKGKDWATADPLGLGGLLVDAYRIEQLLQQGSALDERLLETVLTTALEGIPQYMRSGDRQRRAEHRLGFRELGLTIGLHAVRCLWQTWERNPERLSTRSSIRVILQALMQYAPLADEIELFWRNPEHQRTGTWLEHRDINEVMLATSLQPKGFLVLSSYH
jgi:hypothetical protein